MLDPWGYATLPNLLQLCTNHHLPIFNHIFACLPFSLSVPAYIVSWTEMEKNQTYSFSRVQAKSLEQTHINMCLVNELKCY